VLPGRPEGRGRRRRRVHRRVRAERAGRSGRQDEAREYAAVVATGRSDYPNQINNVLAFPGVFRGLLDAQSTKITDTMLVAAARALADVVPAEELGPDYIVPSVFHPDVASGVAAAVREVALAE
jgi:malate dehydrogenase (oxaloacetate-decarboxylating)